MSIAKSIGVLQLAGGLGHAFAAHAEHAGDQLLRHDQLAR